MALQRMENRTRKFTYVSLKLTKKEIMILKSWYGSAHHWHNHKEECRIVNCHRLKNILNKAYFEEVN